MVWETRSRSTLNNACSAARCPVGASLRCRRPRYNSGIWGSSALRCIQLDHRSRRAALLRALLGGFAGRRRDDSVAQLAEQRAVVAATPDQRQTAGADSADRPDGDPLARNVGRIAFGQQADAEPGGERLHGFLRAGDLGADTYRGAASFLGGQPVVAQAAAAGRKREKGFVEYVGDVEVVPAGERVSGR